MSFSDETQAIAFGNKVRTLEAYAPSLIGRTEVALHVIEHGAAELATISVKAGEATGSRVLDEFCLAVGREATDASLSLAHRKETTRRRFVHVVTVLYRDGGHSRVLEDIVRSLPDDEHFVLWLSGENDLREEDYAGSLRVEPLPAIFCVRGSLGQCVVEGARILDALDPDFLILLGHPNDPVSLALMGPRDGCRRLVIHHADHGFSLGRFVPNATHVSLTRRFSLLAEERWGITTTFLPLTCPDPLATANRVASQVLITASSAAAHKFDLDGRPSYLEVLRERFTRREGTHVHFGSLTPIQVRRIGELLDEVGARDRFELVPFVESLALGLVRAGVDVYIDSVPNAGAKSLIESMAAGVATCFSAHDSSFDGSTFAFDGAFLWKTAAELGEHLADLDERKLQIERNRAREHYDLEHSPEVFATTLRAILQNARIDKRARRPYERGLKRLRRTWTAMTNAGRLCLASLGVRFGTSMSSSKNDYLSDFETYFEDSYIERAALALPLRKPADAYVLLRLSVRVSSVGDVNATDAGVHSGSLERPIQGMTIDTADGSALLEYRVRFGDGSWSDWHAQGRYAGSTGHGPPLTGVSIRPIPEFKRHTKIECVGLFVGEARPIRSNRGADCTSGKGGLLYGIQINVLC